MDVLFLSRLQFALTVMFHYLFPPLSIGLGLVMVISEGLYLKTKDPVWEEATKFWIKIFAVNFAVGVATGIVMEFEFGTNWATYSRYVGDIFGSALAAEGIFAFFLESGFLAILVFGWHRVSAKMHFFAALMVLFGSIFSAVWIVIANSWQQTPAGYHIVGTGLEARAEVTEFWAMIFNPSAMHRLGHVLLGSFIQGAFFVTSVCAWYILKKRHLEFAKRSFTLGLGVALISSVTIAISGHSQAVAVSQNQPAKMAALEGHYRSSDGGTDLYLFGVPDDDEQRVKAGVALPNMLSVLIHGDPNEPVRALDTFPADERPPVQIPFQTYHLMVALGIYFIALTSLAAFLRWRGTLFDKRWLMWIFVGSAVAPIIANQAGWVAAEVGRQPWVVYGLLRTSDALSKAVIAEHVLVSIVLFGLIYLMLLFVWLFVLNSKIQHGPEDPEKRDHDGEGGLLDTAAQRADAAAPSSMTLARAGTGEDAS